MNRGPESVNHKAKLVGTRSVGADFQSGQWMEMVATALQLQRVPYCCRQAGS